MNRDSSALIATSGSVEHSPAGYRCGAPIRRHNLRRVQLRRQSVLQTSPGIAPLAPSVVGAECYLRTATGGNALVDQIGAGHCRVRDRSGARQARGL